MIDPHAAALSYLRFVLESLDISPTALAKEVGVSATTLTRPLNNPDHKYAISTSTIAKIAQRTSINPGPFFESEDVVSRHFNLMKDVDQQLGDILGPDIMNMRRKALNIVGTISPGGLQESAVLEANYYPPFFVKLTHLPSDDVFGVGIIGEGANMIAKEGEVLLCSKCSSLPEPFNPADLFIIPRTAKGGRLVELLVCFFQRVDDEWVLSPASRDLKHRTRINPVELQRPSSDVRLLGVVECVIRHPWAS